MKKRFSEEQIIGFLKQAEAGVPVKELCRQHGFSDASFYNWRARSGGMSVPDAKRLKCTAQQDARRGDARQRSAEGGLGPKAETPQERREAVQTMFASPAISERRACALVGISRSVLHYVSREAEHSSQLRARLIELAAERRRFGYRRLHILVQRQGIEANHKRFHR